MQDRKQARIDDQGLGIADQLSQDGAPQGLEVATELAHATVQRGGMEAYDSREQVREEPLGLAQEGALGFDAPKLLLEECEGYDLGGREFFEGLVVVPFGVEPVIDVVYLAEQNGRSLFQEGQPWGKLGPGHLKLLWTGNSDGPRFTLRTTQRTSSASAKELFSYEKQVLTVRLA